MTRRSRPLTVPCPGSGEPVDNPDAATGRCGICYREVPVLVREPVLASHTATVRRVAGTLGYRAR